MYLSVYLATNQTEKQIVHLWKRTSYFDTFLVCTNVSFTSNLHFRSEPIWFFCKQNHLNPQLHNYITSCMTCPYCTFFCVFFRCSYIYHYKCLKSY